MKFFLMGTNLFLLQDKIKAYDPENSSIMNYPIDAHLFIWYQCQFLTL